MAAQLIERGQELHVMSTLMNNGCTHLVPGIRLVKVCIPIRQVRFGARADRELAWSRRCMTIMGSHNARNTNIMGS